MVYVWVSLGRDLGLGRRASWAVHGIGAWVHGMVHGILGLPYLFGVPDPVTSLWGGCYMKWILVFFYYWVTIGGDFAMTTYNRQTDRQTDRGTVK